MHRSYSMVVMVVKMKIKHEENLYYALIVCLHDGRVIMVRIDHLRRLSLQLKTQAITIVINTVIAGIAVIARTIAII